VRGLGLAAGFGLQQTSSEPAVQLPGVVSKPDPQTPNLQTPPLVPHAAPTEACCLLSWFICPNTTPATPPRSTIPNTTIPKIILNENIFFFFGFRNLENEGAVFAVAFGV